MSNVSLLTSNTRTGTMLKKALDAGIVCVVLSGVEKTEFE